MYSTSGNDLGEFEFQKKTCHKNVCVYIHVYIYIYIYIYIYVFLLYMGDDSSVLFYFIIKAPLWRQQET